MPYRDRENLAMSLYLWRQIVRARAGLSLFEYYVLADRHVEIAWS